MKQLSRIVNTLLGIGVVLIVNDVKLIGCCLVGSYIGHNFAMIFLKEDK